MSQADKNMLAYVGKKPGDRDSDAWFTPKRYVELVRGALGSIDFDPFSSVEAQMTVQAGSFFTVEDNALVKPWPECETVFMNPPYSKGMCAAAVKAFTDNFDAGRFKRGVVLVNNASDTNWWDFLTNHSGCLGLCLTRGRISFMNVDGKAISGNTRGQAFILFGFDDDIKPFRSHFEQIGKVWS